MLVVGEEFEGYVVDATLGRGGYATVYRAHAPGRPNRAVALKVLDEQHRGEDQTARLRREFEFAHQLDHPHVVTVYEHGVGWLTMELVDGGTATVLTERKEISWPRWRRSPRRWTTSIGVASCTATSSRPISLSRRTFPARC